MHKTTAFARSAQICSTAQRQQLIRCSNLWRPAASAQLVVRRQRHFARSEFAAPKFHERLGSVLERSFEGIRDNAQQAYSLELLEWQPEMSLIDFTRPGELEKLVVGSDADMDGSSAAALELLVEDHGKITEYVPPEQPKESKKLQQQQQQQTGKGGLNPSSRPYNPFTARALDLPDDEITFNDDISTISGRMAGKDDVDQDKLWMWCDQDAIDGDPSSPSFTFARFYGRISTAVPEKRHFVRSGYAGFRNRKRTSTLFGSVEWDCSLYRYLALRVRSPPLPAMSAASPTNGAAQDFKPQTDEQILTADKPRSFVVNVIPAGLEGQDLFQHRLYLHRPGQWETVLIPLNDFASVSSGALVSNQQQLYRERVHTVGISLADGVDGPFALDVRWIKCVNTAYTNGNSEHFGGIPHRSKKH